MSPRLVAASWSAPAAVKAYFTTRIGGFSEGPWSSLNLGLGCGDQPSSVDRNRSALERLLPAPPLWLKQVHGTAVVRHPGQVDGEPTADACAASGPGRVCAVLTADCLPVLFCNRNADRVAAAHAGWRGLSAGILEATVRALDEDPGELIAWLGPAIGPRAYEVGQDVVDAFAGEFPAGFEPRGERWLMDLHHLARLRLSALGVQSVYADPFCTFSEPGRFYSYRRDGVTGRMASIIWLERQ
jgi:YfiH family protein